MSQLVKARTIKQISIDFFYAKVIYNKFLR